MQRKQPAKDFDKSFIHSSSIWASVLLYILFSPVTIYGRLWKSGKYSPVTIYGRLWKCGKFFRAAL